MGVAIRMRLDGNGVVPDSLPGRLRAQEPIQDLMLEGLLSGPNLGVELGYHPPEICTLKRGVFGHKIRNASLHISNACFAKFETSVLSTLVYIPYKKQKI